MESKMEFLINPNTNSRIDHLVWVANYISRIKFEECMEIFRKLEWHGLTAECSKKGELPKRLFAHPSNMPLIAQIFGKFMELDSNQGIEPSKVVAVWSDENRWVKQIYGDYDLASIPVINTTQFKPDKS